MNYMKEFRSAYKLAERQAGGAIFRHISLNGLSIKLCFAGTVMLDYVMPAFAHLICSPLQEISLTVCLWDSQTTNSPLPNGPWTESIRAGREDRVMFNRDDFHLLYCMDSNVCSAIDTSSRMAFYQVPTVECLPYYETAAPMRMILHWWAELNEMCFIHAAAVSFAGKAVLLVGRGGAGKSTTALVGMQCGLEYIGDDYIMISLAPIPKAFSIYGTAKVNPTLLDAIPDLQNYMWHAPVGNGDKAILYLGHGSVKHITTGVPIKAIFMPVIKYCTTPLITRESTMKIFSELAVSTIFQMPGSGNKTLKGIAELVKSTPGFTLSLSKDLYKNAAALKTFLQQLGE